MLVMLRMHKTMLRMLDRFRGGVYASVLVWGGLVCRGAVCVWEAPQWCSASPPPPPLSEEVRIVSCFQHAALLVVGGFEPLLPPGTQPPNHQSKLPIRGKLIPFQLPEGHEATHFFAKKRAGDERAENRRIRQGSTSSAAVSQGQKYEPDARNLFEHQISTWSFGVRNQSLPAGKQGGFGDGWPCWRRDNQARQPR